MQHIRPKANKEFLKSPYVCGAEFLTFNNSISDNKGIDGEISSRKGVLT